MEIRKLSGVGMCELSHCVLSRLFQARKRLSLRGRGAHAGLRHGRSHEFACLFSLTAISSAIALEPARARRLRRTP